MGQSVARIGLDLAGGIFVAAPQTTVFVNDTPAGAPALAATEGSTTISGSVVITSDVSVFVEDKKIAVEGARTTGAPVGKASPNVFAGKGK